MAPIHATSPKLVGGADAIPRELSSLAFGVRSATGAGVALPGRCSDGQLSEETQRTHGLSHTRSESVIDRSTRISSGERCTVT